MKSPAVMPANCGREWQLGLGSDAEVCLERHVGEGENPVRGRGSQDRQLHTESRVVWECSPKLVVNSI